jgi:hypothetical protein
MHCCFSHRKESGVGSAIPGTRTTRPVPLRTIRDDECQVTVRYDVTALSRSGGEFVRSLEVEYQSFIEGWRAEILPALETERTVEQPDA